jgi:hypothetical protein
MHDYCRVPSPYRCVLTIASGLTVAVLFSACSTGGGGTTPLAFARHAASSQSEPSPAPTGSVMLPLNYNSQTVCIAHHLFTNNVLPPNVGEFATNGLDDSYWGASHSRTQAPAATWPGYSASWGKFQYDTYFGNPNDGSGLTPFSVTKDTAVAGSPTALRILAEPMPQPMKDNPAYGDGWTASNLTSSIVSPAIGGSITIPVSGVNVTHQGWLSGIGRPKVTGGSGEDDPQGVVFLGQVTSGGCTVDGSGNCTGGSTSITLSNVQYFEGGPGTTIPSGADFQDWDFPDYYSGTLDTNINQQYGFFVARIRLPKPLPALSPAWWMLETGGVGQNPPGSGYGNALRSEWDIEEQFAADYRYKLNTGNILWNSGGGGNNTWYSYGCGLGCPNEDNTTQPGATGVYRFPKSSRTNGNYNAAYHDYGVLVEPGGPQFPTNYAGTNGVYVEDNAAFAGTTFFLDGYPIAGHLGQPDLTQGSPDKELMLMFQVGFPGSWLDPNSTALQGNPWPQNMWIQWIRAYQPTTQSC